MVVQRHLVAFLLFISLLGLSVQCRAGDPLHFSWALLIDTSKGIKALDFSSPVSVSEGTTLQLYLDPDNRTFVYVFLHDSTNQFVPVFPSARNYYDSNAAGTPVYIPAGEDRFTTVPPAGQERFYLIAAAERLTDIEKLMEKCRENPDDINIHATLFRKVRALRKAHSTLTQFTEKGMPVSGTVNNLNATRGTSSNVTFTAVDVKGEDFYSRILRLNHE